MSVGSSIATLLPLLLAAAAGAAPKAVEAELARVLDGLAPAVEPTVLPPIRRTLAERMRESHTPGVAVAVIVDGRVRWVRGFGTTEAAGSARVTATTRFMVQSVSKAVTAFGILRMVERGALELDGAIDPRLGRWHIPAGEFSRPGEPTLRQTLSHAGGFGVRGVPTYAEGEAIPTLVQALDGVPPAKGSPVRLVYAPGSRTSYSGGGYSVLQLLVEDVTGEGFARAMERRVLAPLAMRRSRFAVGVPADWQASAAVGHDPDGRSIPGRWRATVQVAAGGLVSTADDLARFVIEVGRAWRGESRLLSQSAAREMLTRGSGGWGLGLEVEGDELSFAHTGSGDGFKSLVMGWPARGAGVVVLANADGAGDLRHELARSVAREYGWPRPTTLRRAAVNLEEPARRALAGRYTFTDGSVLEVSDVGGRLRARHGGQGVIALHAASGDTLFGENGEEFAFTMSGGEAEAVEWRGGFGKFTARRQREPAPPPP